MNAVFKSLYHHAVQKKVLLWITLLSAVILFFYSFGVTETFVQEHPKVLFVTSTSKLNGAELNSPRTNGYTISSVKSKDDGFRNIFGDESNFDKLDKISTKGNLSISNNLFDINSTDVIVDLHIQKTSGSAFGRHLVHDLKLVSKCKGLNKKIHRCLRPVGQDEGWLFSRFTTGWMCGVHAGWTSLTECVPKFYQDFDLKRRYFYITVLREPIARYLSELGHVQRGATWAQFDFICNHTKQPLDLCWNKDAENWSNVTLQEFMDCDVNLACNRQTRMLADLKLTGCAPFGDEDHDKIMLESAKRNLQSMEYFGLAERQVDSQFLFEKTFGFEFKIKFLEKTQTHASERNETEDVLSAVKKKNYLDLELYEFAKDLFSKRFNHVYKLFHP